MKVALFVEGTDQSTSSVADSDPLARLWNETLCRVAGVRAFDVVIGFSKRNIVAMDPAVKSLSGVGESFDELLIRMEESHEFEAAVVAWDLHPRWNPQYAYCRWQETLNFYTGIASSARLAPGWRDSAAARLAEYESRSVASERTQMPILSRFSIQALCMDRMFESVLMIDDGRALREALGVEGTRVPLWPKAHRGQKEDEYVAKAIAACRRAKINTPLMRGVRGDFDTAKHEWGGVLAEKIARGRFSASLTGHPTIRRLAEIR